MSHTTAVLRQTEVSDALVPPPPAIDRLSLVSHSVFRGEPSSRLANASLRIHDRAQLEIALSCPLRSGDDEYEWESYFFVPESLRLRSQQQFRSGVYDDLQSYTRLTVRRYQVGDLAGEPLRRLNHSLGSDKTSDEDLVNELKLFACTVRESLFGEQRDLKIELGMESARSDLHSLGERFATTGPAARDILNRFRSGPLATLRQQCWHGPHVVEAARWIDEHLSCFVEARVAKMALALRESGAPECVTSPLAACAVQEARYRKDAKLSAVGRGAHTPRDIEHLDFRRHMLKRFACSILWLKLDIGSGIGHRLHLLYAGAAAVAMGLAVVFAMCNGTMDTNPNIYLWSVVAVLAYALKDRCKAMLQSYLATIASKHFPDRRWAVDKKSKGKPLASVRENSDFIETEQVPAAVMNKRRGPHQQGFQEHHRPEHVLHHRKVYRVNQDRAADFDAVYDRLTEICRLNILPWLEYAADPSRDLVFADPDDGHVYSAPARRVYNIAMVYRFRRRRDNTTHWQQVRLVVSRNGLERLDTMKARDVLEF